MDNMNINQGLTANLVKVGAVAGTTSSFTTTAIVSGATINGKWTAPLAVQTNAATPTVDAATGQPFVPLMPNQCCTLVFGVNAAGALQMCQGKVIPCNVGVGATQGGLLNDPQFPGLPNDFCPVAYTVVSTAPSAAPWTPGAGAWTATGVAATTFQNVSQLPSRPQAS
jgi:hypothetical protein